MKNTLKRMQDQFDLIVKVIDSQKTTVDEYTMKTLFYGALTTVECDRFQQFVWAFNDEIVKQVEAHNNEINLVNEE